MPLLRLSLCAALFVAATSASAQSQVPKQASPEEMKQLMEASMGAMVPMMGRMTEAMIDAQLRATERPETAQRLAAFKKNLFDALVQQGFTKEQAFQIVLNTALPSATPTSK
ncbi:MAG: hypothetical protein IIA03_01135 [Proteobacteria bacterium]|jgi:hypothetical protein|nr:hypothetical protein [Pseudomonas aeruginosa]MBA4216037.1 hypothetical protein [Methylibium sp.]MBY0366320.1 hypothetical protein [Burkholderiaceae bacterium]MCH8854868.1 hypothetical protein [Pseudomonadota bacterium]|mmetsp:Transcript_53684/g.126307  ORF Transcript_53684/g.126307 Transcript_53684/m.126307 type:complete len:112 (-) Transcript_53684:1705-2040(-)